MTESFQDVVLSPPLKKKKLKHIQAKESKRNAILKSISVSQPYAKTVEMDTMWTSLVCHHPGCTGCYDCTRVVTKFYVDGGRSDKIMPQLRIRCSSSKKL